MPTHYDQFAYTLRAWAVGALVGLFSSSALMGSANAQAPEQPQTEDAQDDTTSQVERLAAEAREQYERGQHRKALSSYLRALKITASAGLIYNIAFIYDYKLGEKQLALDYYRSYVKAADAEPDVVERALERIEALKHATRPRAAPIKPSPEAASHTPSETSSSRLAGWITLSAGSVALATGLTLGLLASDDHASYKAAKSLSLRQSLRDKAQTRALAGDIVMGVGVAAIGASLLLLLQDDSPRSEEQLQVNAAALSDGAVLLLGGTL